MAYSSAGYRSASVAFTLGLLACGGPESHPTRVRGTAGTGSASEETATSDPASSSPDTSDPEDDVEPDAIPSLTVLVTDSFGMVRGVPGELVEIGARYTLPDDWWVPFPELSRLFSGQAE